MKALNKETAPKTQRPERIIQFGEGNFLRNFQIFQKVLSEKLFRLY